MSDINTNNPLTKWKDRVSNFMENVLKSVTDVNHFVSRYVLIFCFLVSFFYSLRGICIEKSF